MSRIYLITATLISLFALVAFGGGSVAQAEGGAGGQSGAKGDSSHVSLLSTNPGDPSGDPDYALCIAYPGLATSYCAGTIETYCGTPLRAFSANLHDQLCMIGDDFNAARAEYCGPAGDMNVGCENYVAPLPPSEDYQRWLAGFSTPLPDTPTQSDGAFFARTGANNQIIEVAGSTNQYHRILRFDESDLVDLDTAGDKPISGISLLSATVGESRYFAAGLAQGAKVGAPIVDPRTDVQWVANIAMLYGGNTSTQFNTDFNLCLNFAQRSFFARNNNNDCNAQYGKRIKNTNGGATPYLKITKGTWDESGLISDTRGLVFNDGDSSITGRLMGLIGQQGAIAAFNGNDADTHFAGGFVAKNPDFTPPVQILTPGSFAAWRASFADGALLAQGEVLTVALATGTHFIAGSEVGLGGVNATVLRLNDLTGVSDAMGGIAYGSAEVGEHVQYYAGLLDGADVGSVLLEAPPAGGWHGRVSLIAQNGSIVNQPVSLTFNFEYNHFSNGTTKTFGDDTFTFLGTWDKSGVISGTASFDEDGDSAGVAAQSGSMSGLIGQNGAIGVFKSDDATSNPFVGGFVAHPSATASNDE